MMAKLEISDPRHFGMREVVLANLFCFAPYSVIGAVSAMLAFVAGLAIGAILGGLPAAFAFLFVLTCGLGLLILIFPVLQANPYLRMLVKNRLGAKAPDSVCYVCQIALIPRLYGGLRGFLEDADDIGMLELTGEGIVFDGDHISLAAPYESVVELTEVNPGYRMLWMAGSRIRLRVNTLDGVRDVELMERESSFIPESRRLAREMAYGIKYGMQLANEEEPDAIE